MYSRRRDIPIVDERSGNCDDYACGFLYESEHYAYDNGSAGDGKHDGDGERRGVGHDSHRGGDVCGWNDGTGDRSVDRKHGDAGDRSARLRAQGRFTASYGGDTNYAVSSGTASETVTAAATATTISLSPSTSYNGGTVTITATVTPATYGTVTFKNGSTTIGPATVNASGVATLAYTVPSGLVGGFLISASYTSGAGGALCELRPARRYATLTVAAAVTVTSSAMHPST